MSETSAKRKYDIEYAKNKLKRIPLDVQKEKYEEIKAAQLLLVESCKRIYKKGCRSANGPRQCITRKDVLPWQNTYIPVMIL